jgi:hypothetical protein
MSRVYFHSPSGTAELWGGERAWLGSLVSDLTAGVMKLDYQGERIRELIQPGHYLHGEHYQGHDRYLAWHNSVELNLSTAIGDFLAWNGRDIGTFSLVLNTACAVGGDAVKLAARIHGQCEIHCYVEGVDRMWLAAIIGQGLAAGVFRRNTGYPHRTESWEHVQKFLRDRDDEPVVMSYSVTDSFPGPYVAGWLPPVDWRPEDVSAAEWEALDGDERAGRRSEGTYEAWSELTDAEHWQIGMDALRAASGGLRIDPAEWTAFRFGHELTMFDLLAEDYRDRLDKAFPVLAVTS